MDSVIGVPRPRTDSPEKVSGATRYAGDDVLPGLLHGWLVLSTEAHATIVSIEKEAALAVPGVVAVLTADDLPVVAEGSGRSNEPLACSEVVFSGQPIALVVAESEAAAEDGAEVVMVEYESLEPVLDLEGAMRPGAALGGTLMLVEPLAAGAALVLGRPVRLLLTRSEDFQASNPAPAAIFELRVGARRSGELTGLDARIVCDRGSTIEWGLEDISSTLVGGGSEERRVGEE